MKTKLPAPQSVPDPVADLLSLPESLHFETKRVSGKMPHKALETIVAFANTEGGNLVLGVEDIQKVRRLRLHQRMRPEQRLFIL